MSKKNLRRHMPQPKLRQRMGDYRIFVGAFPEGPIIDQIQEVRQRLDAQTAVITPPHLTLAGTYWRSGTPSAASESTLIHRLTHLSQHLSPFTMTVGGISTFGSRVIYLDVKRSQKLLSVRRSLLQLIGRDKHRKFRPHLTLTMRIEGEAFDAALAELQESEWQNGRFSFPITQLHLMQRGPRDPAWRSIHTIELKKESVKSEK